MTAGVLFDAPGPRPVARHRIYSDRRRSSRLLALVAFVV